MVVWISLILHKAGIVEHVFDVGMSWANVSSYYAATNYDAARKKYPGPGAPPGPDPSRAAHSRQHSLAPDPLVSHPASGVHTVFAQHQRIFK